MKAPSARGRYVYRLGPAFSATASLRPGRRQRWVPPLHPPRRRAGHTAKRPSAPSPPLTWASIAILFRRSASAARTHPGRHERDASVPPSNSDLGRQIDQVRKRTAPRGGTPNWGAEAGSDQPRLCGTGVGTDPLATTNSLPETLGLLNSKGDWRLVFRAFPH